MVRGRVPMCNRTAGSKFSPKSEEWDIFHMCLSIAGCIDLQDGQTPLIAAAENGHANVVRLLVDTGASIDASQQDGMTAVSQAVGGGHIETLKILVDAGADVHKVFQSHVQDTGTSPIHVAAYTGNTEAIEILLQRVLTLMYP
eukprot:m.312863 g.312863  ORF g.312863 m.312863 type:complete len:143 (+) comp16405_c0_seq17:113-541(+)